MGAVEVTVPAEVIIAVIAAVMAGATMISGVIYEGRPTAEAFMRGRYYKYASAIWLVVAFVMVGISEGWFH